MTTQPRLRCEYCMLTFGGAPERRKKRPFPGSYPNLTSPHHLTMSDAQGPP